MSPLEIAGLVKRFGDGANAREVVRGLDLRLEPGECFALLGPNGAGKTTTLRCALGLTAATAGSIRLCGLPVPERARDARARVGVVPQLDSLDPDFTCAENLLVFAGYFGLAERDVRPRIPELLAFAGLEGKDNARIQSLSGGMKRRLTLARALVNQPELLILDEPTTGLDPQARHLIWERLRRLTAEGTTILLTTHFMDEAERLCSRLLVLDHGKKIAEGKPRELIAQHLESDVVEVFGVGAVALAEDAHLRALAARVEISGETVFFYTQNAQPLLQALGQHGHLRTLHRPANLEDLFLKLTGRQIRE